MAKALDHLVANKVPGVSTLTVSKDMITDAASAGVRDLATGAPTTVDTVHLWFSMTKIVTATATMQLAERAALSLDDPVEQYLPGFPARRGGWPQVRVRHLLSHSAGLPNPVPVRWVHRPDAEGRDPHEFALALLGRYRCASRRGRRPSTQTSATSPWERWSPKLRGSGTRTTCDRRSWSRSR